MTDAAIHRISRKANGFVSSLTGSQWIATGIPLVLTTNFVIAENDSAKVQFFFFNTQKYLYKSRHIVDQALDFDYIKTNGTDSEKKTTRTQKGL